MSGRGCFPKALVEDGRCRRADECADDYQRRVAAEADNYQRAIERMERLRARATVIVADAQKGGAQ
jgi:hypothetical protein